ncbi:MAG: DUF86 domain-containing protein [Desulfarculus sp.]|nr:DUF86 domain-containing protein [Desulfarculus sp.]
MSKRHRLYIEDILSSLAVIPSFIEGYDKPRFLADLKTQYAVIRALGIIGDAVKKLPPEFRAAHPEIPWKDMAKTRDVLIHDYLRVDLDVLWDTITRDLPPLAAKLRPLLEE